jgi:predicted nucleotide-binding protein
MNDLQRKQLASYAEEAQRLEREVDICRWSNRVAEFLEQAMGPDVAKGFRILSLNNNFDDLALQLGHIEGLTAKDDLDTASLHVSGEGGHEAAGITRAGAGSRRIFVVHGHDGEVKETVARFLEKLDLEAVILHEQPNQGRTLIEKFEVSSSDIAFAVILLTPDDVGAPAVESSKLHPRARQNVILEFGYFMGRLTRTRVCALYKGGVELPSDYQGVVYIEFDLGGAWRTKLAQELVEAGLKINVHGLISK